LGVRLGYWTGKRRASFAQRSLFSKKMALSFGESLNSLIHSARALLFAKRNREKSHYAALVAIRDLYAGEIERSLIQEFEHGMYLRQEAGYGLKFSESEALDAIPAAERLLQKAKAILKIQ